MQLDKPVSALGFRRGHSADRQRRPPLSTPTPHRFNDPIWPIQDVLGWLLNRDPARFGRMVIEDDLQSAISIASHYTSQPPTKRDPKTARTLLRALQRDELIAYEGANPVHGDFWVDKTPRYLRASTRFLFRRDEVLSLWPDPRAQITHAPPPIRPLRGGRATALIGSIEDENRAPNWQKWKHVGEAKLSEAVALSLNIAPEKLRRNREILWDGQLFNESKEFADRLFIAERNLETLRPSNLVAMRYDDEDPAVRLRNFAAWAVGIYWTLPPELTEMATLSTAGSWFPKPVTAPRESNQPRQRYAAPERSSGRVYIQSKRAAVAFWIGERYPNGIPPGKTAKEIAREFENEKKTSVGVRTVRRALGGR